MRDFIEEIITKTEEYGVSVSELSIGLAIELFADIRNYPSSWDDDKKLVDMRKNISKISMASIEIDSKDGAENQTSHSENGVSRSYYNGIMAYKNVVGFADVV